MWEGWRAVSAPQMKADYARLVELANEGSRELGYADTGTLWRSWYDMPPDAIRRQDRCLWSQVEPLYAKSAMLCARPAEPELRLGRATGRGPIRADLLGNMWGQAWGNIFDIVAPRERTLGYDLSGRAGGARL